MHPELQCISVVSHTPKLLEWPYAFRLVVPPCQYLPNLLPFFQPIFPSLLSHISSVAVPHHLCYHIHFCCLASPPPCMSAAVLPTDLFFHPKYSISPPRLHCYPCASLLQSLLYYLPSFGVIHRRCLSTFSDRIFSLLCVLLYYTACSALLQSIFLGLRSDPLTTLFFSIFAWLFSLSVIFHSAPIYRIFLHLPSICYDPIWSLPSDMSDLICLIHLWYDQLWLLSSCSDMLPPIFFDRLAQICFVFCSSGPCNFS